MYPREKDTDNNWTQWTSGVNVKDDKLFSVADLSENGFFAYVDGVSDTQLKIFKITTGGVVTNAPVQTIGGGGADIFMCLNREQNKLYVGLSDQTTIYNFNADDITQAPSTIANVGNNVKGMKIDKDGFLTVISHNGANTEVDRFDTNGDTHEDDSIQVGSSMLFTVMYFSVENYLIVGTTDGVGYFARYSLSGGVYSQIGALYSGVPSVNDITVDIYNNLVWISDVAISKLSISEWTTPYSSDAFTATLHGLSTDSYGNYYFSQWTSANVQAIHMYADDENAASFTAGNFSILRRNIATKCSNIDMFAYDVSADGSSGR
jgi:hypothetical protein